MEGIDGVGEEAGNVHDVHHPPWGRSCARPSLPGSPPGIWHARWPDSPPPSMHGCDGGGGPPAGIRFPPRYAGRYESQRLRRRSACRCRRHSRCRSSCSNTRRRSPRLPMIGRPRRRRPAVVIPRLRRSSRRRSSRHSRHRLTLPSAMRRPHRHRPWACCARTHRRARSRCLACRSFLAASPSIPCCITYLLPHPPPAVVTDLARSSPTACLPGPCSLALHRPPSGGHLCPSTARATR